MKTLFKILLLIVFTYIFIVVLFGFLNNNISHMTHIVDYLKNHLIKILDLTLTLFNNTISPEINYFIRDFFDTLLN